MKQIIVILLITTFSINIDSQVYKHNFLGDDFLLYKGVFLKIDVEATSGFAKTFYKELSDCRILYCDNVIYPNTKQHYNTEKDSLLNRIFIVENIIDENGSDWDESVKLSYEDPVLVLKDTLTKQIIYYKYNKNFDSEFPFLTTKIANYEEIINSRLEREIDDFTGTLRINSPITKSTIIYKYIKRKKISYYLSLHAYGNTVNVNTTGVTILFTDGTKWLRQSQISVEANKDYFEYSAFITLTADDLILFSTKKIKKFRLFIYDNNLNSADAERFRLSAKCIRKAK